MLCYCKKCGRIIYIMLDTDEHVCDCCDSSVFQVPKEFLKTKWSIKEELEQQFINEYIKTSPEFDEEQFNQRDNILAQKNLEFDTKMAIGKAIASDVNPKDAFAGKTNVPECPTCHSKNIRKIGGVERGASIAAFGLFSKKINKSFKCGNCGYTW